MTCIVTLINSKFADVTHSTIQLSSVDSGTILETHSNGSMSKGYGAKLTAMSSSQIYDVVIDTSSTSYVPPVLENFNGARDSEIDVVLLIPPTTSSGSASSTAQLSSFIQAQDWSDNERRAVYTLIRTLSYMKQLIVMVNGTLIPVGNFFPQIARKATLSLREIGIATDLVR